LSKEGLEKIAEKVNPFWKDVFLNLSELKQEKGELVFDSNFKNEYPGHRSGLNATEVISYQYLGMTKIAGALNILPRY
jgi:hypothetical protein